MSLLWRDEYVAALSPTRVACIRRGRTHGSRLVGERDCASADPSAWMPAAVALSELIAESGVSRRTRTSLRVVLSNHFSRFCLLPWSEEIRSREELQAYARIRFETIYGSAAADWMLSVSPAPAGRPRLAAAIEADLFERLQEIGKAAGLRLVSVQPYLMTAFNRLGRHVGSDDFVFVVAEPQRSSLLAARAGSWISVRSMAGSDSDEALGGLIERESELLGFEAGSMPSLYVHAPGRPDCATGPVRGRVPTLLGFPVPAVAPTASAVRVMAMAGA